MAGENKSALPVIDSWSAAYEDFIVGHAGERPRKGAPALDPAEFESEDEQRDSLFPEKKHKRRRSRHRRHGPKSDAVGAAAAETSADKAQIKTT